ncbi:MAG: hypothetical protein WCS86_01980 [Candidatus Paceibacterota bacterium]
MKNNFKNFLIVSVTILIFSVYFGFNHPVDSSVLQNVSGYGWSADSEGGGMGWLSFNNCVSTGNCGIADYGVNIDLSGDVSGYAWSSNYGWLSFNSNELTGCPSGICSARKEGNNLVGWARFCSVFASGCSGALLPTTATGGWDGWVSLSGANYGVKLNQTADSYAWGGPDIVGWIDFSKVVMKIAGTSMINFNSAPVTYSYPPLYKNKLSWSSMTSSKLTDCKASNTSSDISWDGDVEDAPALGSSSSKIVIVPVSESPVKYDLHCFDNLNSKIINADPVFLLRKPPEYCDADPKPEECIIPIPDPVDTKIPTYIEH